MHDEFAENPRQKFSKKQRDQWTAVKRCAIRVEQIAQEIVCSADVLRKGYVSAFDEKYKSIAHREERVREAMIRLNEAQKELAESYSLTIRKTRQRKRQHGNR